MVIAVQSLQAFLLKLKIHGDGWARLSTFNEENSDDLSLPNFL